MCYVQIQEAVGSINALWRFTNHIIPKFPLSSGPNLSPRGKYCLPGARVI